LTGPYCQCALPCDPGEFPCPEGFYCTDASAPPAGFCVHDNCAGVDCQPTATGEKTVCVDGACVPACDIANCGTVLVCRESDGECVPDNCNSFPERCTAGQFCVDGTCVADPCLNVSCTAPEYCVDGACVRSCASVECRSDQMCVMGVCQDNLCAGKSCPMYQVCDPSTGNCTQDQCLGHAACPSGQICDPLSGDCIDDRCLGVECPGAGQVCKDGTCYDPSQLEPPDTTQHNFVSAAGSGCACQAGTRGGGRPATPALLALVGLAALLLRRRREGR
jgi:MYXO-CTERM domain-containing protein